MNALDSEIIAIKKYADEPIFSNIKDEIGIMQPIGKATANE
nr:hypothetical protein [Fluviispira sanaruensis]